MIILGLRSEDFVPSIYTFAIKVKEFCDSDINFLRQFYLHLYGIRT